MENKKIILWATDKNGDGRVMQVGSYDSIEDVQIIVNMFNKDVVLNFEYETEEN
jgi:hypothetical protein